MSVVFMHIVSNTKYSFFKDGVSLQANTGSNRLKLFAKHQHSPECVCCGRKGTEFRLENTSYNQINVNPHFNLYSSDNVLMTQDHIIPKSRGGSDSLENLHIMCTHCNSKKGSKVTEEDFKRGKLRTEGENKLVRVNNEGYSHNCRLPKRAV